MKITKIHPLTYQNSITKLLKFIVISFIFICFIWSFALPIYLIDIDLGRHIKNGELILNGTWDVLYKNFYSYTNPEYPFINHHWFFGVICYLIWHYLNFTGISLFYIIIRIITFWFFFKLAERLSSFPIACAISLLSFPLLISRTDIRPDVLSILFSGLFWWLIDSYKLNKVSSINLKIYLSLFQILWVNTHIFFIMGPILISFFWAHAKINNKKQESKDLKCSLFLVIAATLINPSTLYGL